MNASSISVNRLKRVDQNTISDLNHLFDKGTSWNSKQGEQFLSDPNNLLLIARLNQRLAGFLTAYRLQRFDHRKAEVLLYEIGVDSKFRRQGIATALINHLKSWAKQAKADEIWVLTERSNTPATALYTSLGGKEQKKGNQVMYVFQLT